MSQFRICATTRDNVPVEVLCGWDRPLQGYYLVVERLDLPENHPLLDEQDYYLFDNLALPESHPKTLSPLLRALNQLGVALPFAMHRALVSSEDHGPDAFQSPIYFNATGTEIDTDEYERNKARQARPQVENVCSYRVRQRT